MIKISASVLGADLLRLGEEIELVERLGVPWLHLDNMDGHFVPNISYGPDFVAAIRKKTSLFLDVHLMLDHPDEYILQFARAGADLITVHFEALSDAEATLRAIAAQGVKVGLSINPRTDPRQIEQLLPLCDLVLVMTVEPGYGGQNLRMDCLAKVTQVRAMIEKLGREIDLEVDGGIKPDNVHLAIEAGANVIVTGTGLFRAKNPRDIVEAVCRAQESGSCAR